MALILAFDTSGPHCAAAVLGGDTVLAHRTEAMAKGQAERLMPLIAEIMAEAGQTLNDLDAMAVGIGPGNFTGIRLSVAAARGLSLSLGKPAIGVSTLEALAYDGPRPMLAQLDARRGALYTQEFFVDGVGEPQLTVHPGTLPTDLPRIGNGAGARDAAIPLAIALGKVALTRMNAPITRPAPLYIRPADAAPSRDVAPNLLP